MNGCIGTCSICGGQVMGHTGAWYAVIPPPPGRCASCGAIEAQHGPVIPMRIAPTYAPTYVPYRMQEVFPPRDVWYGTTSGYLTLSGSDPRTSSSVTITTNDTPQVTDVNVDKIDYSTMTIT